MTELKAAPMNIISLNPPPDDTLLKSGERLCIEIANELAVVHGPMLNLQVSWLPNGVEGKTLPEEMVSVGFHIMHPERMPTWLINHLDKADQAQVRD